MFEMIKDKLAKFAEELKRKEEERKVKIIEMTGNDEIAVITDWKPLKGGGANFKTATLEQKKEEGKLIVKPSIGLRLFISMFIFMFGMIPFIIFLSEERYVISIPILIISILLWFFINKMMKLKVFDLLTKSYYEGDYKKSKVEIYFSEIHALQVLTERVSGNKSSYYSYEINMILKDGKRHNIMDHGNLKKIREDAQIIAEFLNIPLWDITNLN